MSGQSPKIFMFVAMTMEEFGVGIEWDFLER